MTTQRPLVEGDRVKTLVTNRPLWEKGDVGTVGGSYVPGTVEVLFDYRSGEANFNLDQRICHVPEAYLSLI